MDRYYNFNFFKKKCTNCNHLINDYKQIIDSLNQNLKIKNNIETINYFCNYCHRNIDCKIFITNYKSVYFIS